MKLLGHRDLDEALAMLDQYLASGVHIDEQINEFGWSLLHVACENEDEPLIRALVMRGVDPNNRCQCGYPPLFLALDIDIDGAIPTGSALTFSTTTLLVALGASPAETDAQGGYLGDWASKYGENVLVEFDKRLAGDI